MKYKKICFWPLYSLSIKLISYNVDTSTLPVSFYDINPKIEIMDLLYKKYIKKNNTTNKIMQKKGNYRKISLASL